jgi:hypothetical protein
MIFCQISKLVDGRLSAALRAALRHQFGVPHVKGVLFEVVGDLVVAAGRVAQRVLHRLARQQPGELSRSFGLSAIKGGIHHHWSKLLPSRVVPGGASNGGRASPPFRRQFRQIRVLTKLQDRAGATSGHLIIF